MKRIGIFLVAVALVVEMVGCVGVKYDLTITSTAGGSVSNPGEGAFTYNEASVVDLIAKPASGYRFVNWTGDMDYIADVEDATTTITINGGYSITANFAALYELAISSTEGGSVTAPGEGRSAYDEGTVVNLVAEADEGYRFETWTGDVDTIADINAATTTITVNGDYAITANFEEVTEYDLTITSTARGSVSTPGEGTFTYEEGTVVNLVAEADERYRFENWTGDVDTIADINAAITTITMQGNYTITANFAIQPAQCYLTISSTRRGSVTVPGEGTFVYDKGTVVSLVAEPWEGIWFYYWSGEVRTIADIWAATTTITMNGDYAIRAEFLDPTCGCG
jgi:hypothetical protein